MSSGSFFSRFSILSPNNARMEKEHTKPTPYSTYFLVFLGLVSLLMISIGATHFDLGIYSVMAALIISIVQAVLVLSVYMHLRINHRMFALAVAFVVLVFAAVLTVTFLDYLYR